MNPTVSVTAVVVLYGDTPMFPECLEALLASQRVDLDVVVADNGSADGSVERARSAGARVVATGRNAGFGGGCNAGAREARGTFVAFVNPDVVLAPDALARLAEVAARPEVGIASASVRLRPTPHLLNSRGGAIHFLGLGWAEGFEEPATTAGSEAEVMAASGAAMMMRRSFFEELGGFTEELFLYHEDADLSLRSWLRGKAVVYVPDAVALHDYEFSRNPGKLYLLERNRLVVLLTNLEGRTLLLLAPALLVFEVGMVALALAQGWLGEKVRGWLWLARNRAWLRARRRMLQATRVCPDRSVVPLFSARFTGGQVAMPSVLVPADAALAWYWRLVARFV